MPVAIIGRLARDITYRAKGLGLDLLQDAFTRIVSASEIIGLGASWSMRSTMSGEIWKANEFIEYPESSRTFFMPVDTIISGL